MNKDEFKKRNLIQLSKIRSVENQRNFEQFYGRKAKNDEELVEFWVSFRAVRFAKEYDES